MAENTNKGSKFGLGVVIGTILGGLAAFFFSPKSGPENRKMLKEKIVELEKRLKEAKIDEKVNEIYGVVSEEGRKALALAQKELTDRLGKLRQSIDEVDYDKYVRLVSEAVGVVKEKTAETTDRLEKLEKYLLKRFKKK